jgi:hypothetical protein
MPVIGVRPQRISDEPRKSHVVVVETVYHQLGSDQPTTVYGQDGHHYGYDLDSDEEPYSRRKVATEEWKPLDCGWAPNGSLLLIRNDEGGQVKVNSSSEERTDVDDRTLELSYDPDTVQWVVKPGRSMRASPINPQKLSIRCHKGSARYSLCLLPE